jgi:predicted protein tyrosine phosphatase
MPKIIVSSLAKLHDTVREHGARRILTLINAATPVPRPDEVTAENHLFLGFNDITEPMEGMVAPNEAHALEVIRWAREWDRAAPMVVHCYAGISRSTAAAYISALTLNPDMDEFALANEVRRRAPTATPNIRLIGFADEILKRGGRMIDAINAIGRGEDAFEGVPFEVPRAL